MGEVLRRMLAVYVFFWKGGVRMLTCLGAMSELGGDVWEKAERSLLWFAGASGWQRCAIGCPSAFRRR